jgi:hypothetical protein
MSNSANRAREELIRARILRDLAEMAEANRRARLLQSQTEAKRPLPDVPLHQRGFGVMDEDPS